MVLGSKIPYRVSSDLHDKALSWLLFQLTYVQLKHIDQLQKIVSLINLHLFLCSPPPHTHTQTYTHLQRNIDFKWDFSIINCRIDLCNGHKVLIVSDYTILEAVLLIPNRVVIIQEWTQLFLSTIGGKDLRYWPRFLNLVYFHVCTLYDTNMMSCGFFSGLC